ncbi:hypothetical protein ACIRS1_15890 [Kitasatospora sp. NPDC101176]|uniref:hypothetical protein n=1 Tax=Kitasatospora sp. NPDC101176 TaxID=3364099 RepID=UPI00380E1C76
MSVLAFLVPLFLGIAVVTDFRGINRFIMKAPKEASKEGPTTTSLITGWLFIVMSSAVFVSALTRALVS